MSTALTFEQMNDRFALREATMDALARYGGSTPVVGSHLTLNDYQALAMRTNGTTNPTAALTNAALGLAGEAGEFADTVKKLLFHGHPMTEETRTHLIKEVGDVQWYVAQAAYALNVLLGDLAAGNVEKLRRRYPEGFSAEASLNRDMRESLTVDGQNESGVLP